MRDSTSILRITRAKIETQDRTPMLASGIGVRLTDYD